MGIFHLNLKFSYAIGEAKDLRSINQPESSSLFLDTFHRMLLRPTIRPGHLPNHKFLVDCFSPLKR